MWDWIRLSEMAGEGVDLDQKLPPGSTGTFTSRATRPPGRGLPRQVPRWPQFRGNAPEMAEHKLQLRGMQIVAFGLDPAEIFANETSPS